MTFTQWLKDEFNQAQSDLNDPIFINVNSGLNSNPYETYESGFIYLTTNLKMGPNAAKDFLASNFPNLKPKTPSVNTNSSPSDFADPFFTPPNSNQGGSNQGGGANNQKGTPTQTNPNQIYYIIGGGLAFLLIVGILIAIFKKGK